MDFVGRRRLFFLFSAIIIGAGLISTLVPPRFAVGIEFTGGSALSVEFTRPVQQAAVRSLLGQLGHEEAVIQRLGGNSYLVRTRTLAEATGGEASERARLEDALGKLAPLANSDVAAVSPVVAQETVRNAAIAVVIAAVGILFYITWAFRAVPNSFRMGNAAILATVHDVLVVVGTFSILGKFLNLEVNVMFIIGVLTVLGYSVHDTIVVFDRIRENTARRVSRELETIINLSIMEAMGRSLTTSITTLIVITSLILLGGGTILSLLVTLFVGVITGTYSSIAIASQILVFWERREWPWARRAEVEEA